MLLRTLERKPKFTLPDGREIVDLTPASVRYTTDRPIIIDAVFVSAEARMRPDLVSRLTYGTQDYIDFILKYNSISNPFSIDEGDHLVIPEMRMMLAQLAPVAQSADAGTDVRKQYVDPNKVPRPDPAKQEFDQAVKDAAAPGSGGPRRNDSRSGLPPNFAEFGDAEVRVVGGKIIFGPDVAGNSEECRKPVPKGEFLSRVIQARLGR